MKLCDACGKPTIGGIGIGGAFICRSCDPDIKSGIDHLRSQGKPVNALHIAKRIYRETHSDGNYLLRDLPDELWQRAKHRAVDDGDSLRDLIIKSLHLYLG